jgi:uncharacterized protein (DUF1778 family)
MPSAQAKSVRANLRFSREEKELIEQAASIGHQAFSEFIRQNMLKRAKEVIQEQRSIELGHEAWRSFVAMIEEPPRPSQRLKQAMKAFLDNSSK